MKMDNINSIEHKLGLILGRLDAMMPSHGNEQQIKKLLEKVGTLSDRIIQLEYITGADAAQTLEYRPLEIFYDNEKQKRVILSNYQLYDLLQLSNHVAEILIDENESTQYELLSLIQSLKKKFAELPKENLRILDCVDYLYFNVKAQELFGELLKYNLSAEKDTKKDPYQIASQLDIGLLRKISLWEHRAI